MKIYLKIAWGLVWLLPGLWVALLVARCGVDIPHFDPWNGMAPLFAKADARTLTLGDFFAQHNEHRIFFPRLIMYGLARLTHWNIWAELALVWVLAGVCLFGIARTARITGFRATERPWQLLAASALVFTPIAWENWLWGFQIGFMFPVACLMTMVWVAPSVRYPFNFLLTAALCILCTYSVANGFAYWLIALPLLVFSGGRLALRARAGWIAAYLVLFALCTAGYFAGYHKPEALPSPLLLFRHPIQGVACFLAILGIVS